MLEIIALFSAVCLVAFLVLIRMLWVDDQRREDVRIRESRFHHD